MSLHTVNNRLVKTSGEPIHLCPVVLWYLGRKGGAASYHCRVGCVLISPGGCCSPSFQFNEGNGHLAVCMTFGTCTPVATNFLP